MFIKLFYIILTEYLISGKKKPKKISYFKQLLYLTYVHNSL